MAQRHRPRGRYERRRRRALNATLADALAIYLKTKNFHWHMRGPLFRDSQQMLDDQAAQLFAGPTRWPNAAGSSAARR